MSTIIVNVSERLKRDFQVKCASKGVKMSDVIRGFVVDYASDTVVDHVIEYDDSYVNHRDDEDYW